MLLFMTESSDEHLRWNISLAEFKVMQKKVDPVCILKKSVCFFFFANDPNTLLCILWLLHLQILCIHISSWSFDFPFTIDAIHAATRLHQSTLWISVQNAILMHLQYTQIYLLCCCCCCRPSLWMRSIFIMQNERFIHCCSVDVDVSFIACVSTLDKIEKEAFSFVWFTPLFLINHFCYQMNDNKVCVGRMQCALSAIPT